MNIIQGHNFRDLGDVIIDGRPLSLELPINKDNAVIFVKTDYVPIFAEKVLPYLTKPFSIITHNSDIPVDNRHLNLLNYPLLTHWYGMNCHITHPKLTPIPIGVANAEWPHGDTSILSQIMSTIKDIPNFIYCNYDPSTNPSVRYPLIDELKKNKDITFDFNRKSYAEYLRTMSAYKYVISPEGNSVDCHRIWESIYLGVIPIVKRHKALETFADLPILFIDNWNELYTIDLVSMYDKIINNSKEKADFDYYRKLINE